jgi:hypothetical protein
MTEELRIKTISSITGHVLQEIISIWICWRRASMFVPGASQEMMKMIRAAAKNF